MTALLEKTESIPMDDLLTNLGLAPVETETAETSSDPSLRLSPSIFDRAVCLSLNIGGFSNRRKLATSQIEVDADKELINASKRRLVSPELDAINKRDSQMRDYLYTHCLPSPMKKSIFLVPLDLLQKITSELDAYYAQRADLIDDFVSMFPDRVYEARARLRSNFNPLDYPTTPEEIRQEFHAAHSFLQFSTPGALKTFDPKLYEAERQKTIAMWEEARRNIETLLTQEMMNLVADMLEKLNGRTESGKQKVFHKTFLPAIGEWLSDFDARNLCDNAALSQQVGRMRKLMSGVNGTALKGNEATRETLRTGFVEIQKTLSTMLTDRPNRIISFEDE